VSRVTKRNVLDYIVDMVGESAAGEGDYWEDAGTEWHKKGLFGARLRALSDTTIEVRTDDGKVFHVTVSKPRDGVRS
jgi:hypothetical protein